MLKICNDRQDEWAFEVRGRILTWGDLHAADAVYHHKCYRNFSRQQLSGEGSCNRRAGRPIAQSVSDAFESVCELLERSDCELYSISDLVDKMACVCNEPDKVYTTTHMKRKLQARFGEDIFFADMDGRHNVVCFKNVAKRLINDKWYADRDCDLGRESERIVETAAKLIKANIRETLFDTDVYPSDANIRDKSASLDWIPVLLTNFLRHIICDETKQISIGHCIVQASRPRSVISPVLFGVGVSIDHKTGSRGIIQMLSRFGFSISPDEVNRFKQSVVQMPDDNLPPGSPDFFTQWSGDNVDHNVATLDGLGTFHGMGIISMSVEATDVEITHGAFGRDPSTNAVTCVKRLPRVAVDKIAQVSRIRMLHYSPPNIPVLSELRFVPFRQLHNPHVLPPSLNLDLLWHAGWFFRGSGDPRPSWSGFMQDNSAGDHNLLLTYACCQ